MKRLCLVFGFILAASLLNFHCAAFRPRPIFVSRHPTPLQRKKPLPKRTPETHSPHKKQTRGRTAAGSKSPPKKQSLHTVSPASFEFRQAVVRTIDDYLGTPYKWGGTDARGLDCSGFVRVVFARAAHLNLPHNVAQLAKIGQPVSLQNVQFGDLIFFRKPGSGQLFHVGIYLGDDNFAHASTGNGVTISKLTEPYYKARLSFARRVVPNRSQGQQ